MQYRFLRTLPIAVLLALSFDGANAESFCQVRGVGEDPTAAVASVRAAVREYPSLEASELVELGVGHEVFLLGAEGCKASTLWLHIDSRRCIDRKRVNGSCNTHKGWIQRGDLSLGDFERVQNWTPSRIDVGIGDYGYTLQIGASGTVTYRATLPRKCRRGEQPDNLGFCMAPVRYEGGQLYRHQNLVIVGGSRTYIEPLFVPASGALCSTNCAECCESEPSPSSVKGTGLRRPAPCVEP